MKILFLNEYASDRPVSGAEHSQNALAEGLRSVKQKVIIFSPAWKRNQIGEGLSPLWFNNPIYFIYSAWHIYQKIKSEKINLIHVHGKYILPGAVIAGWLTGKPVVATVRDFKFLCPLALCFTHQKENCNFSHYVNKEIPEYQLRYHKISSFKLILAKLWQYQLKWFLNHCQQVIAVSPQLAKIYQNNGVKNIISIYNLPPVQQKTSYVVPQQPLILSLGRLSFGKGTDILIKVAKKMPQVQFVLAGPLNPSFKAEFPQNCRYLGQISHQVALSWYARASAFCLLSRWPEPLSRSGLEALSYGLPIVVSNRGGNKSLIKDNGYLVSLDKISAITEAINQVISRHQLFSQASRKLLVTRFNRQKILQLHINLYQKITL